MPKQLSATCKKSIVAGAKYIKNAYSGVVKRGYYVPNKGPIVKILKSKDGNEGCVRTARRKDPAEDKRIRQAHAVLKAKAIKEGTSVDYRRDYVRSASSKKASPSSKKVSSKKPAVPPRGAKKPSGTRPKHGSHKISAASYARREAVEKKVASQRRSARIGSKAMVVYRPK